LQVCNYERLEGGEYGTPAGGPWGTGRARS
jgi:hypothetical protein